MSALTSEGPFRAFAITLVLYNTLGVVFLDIWGRTDFWEHFAVIDAFARNPLSPANPYVAAAQSTHLFTPFHLLWGLVVALTHSSAYSIAPVVAAANSLLFVLGLRLVAKRLTGSSRFALLLGLAMMFLWFQPYKWSGFHNFGLFPVAFTMPYWCALPLTMIAIGAIDEARPAGVPALLLRAAVVAFVFLVHPLSGSFLALTLVIRAVTEPALAGSARLARAAAAIVGLALTLAWPYFPVLAAIVNAPRFASQSFAGNWKEFYDDFLLLLLPACLGLLYYVRTWRRRTVDWMSWTLLACMALYLLNPIITRSAFLGRYVIYVALLLQWGVVRWLADDNPRALRREVRIALFLAVLVPAAAFETRDSLAWIGAPWSQTPHEIEGDRGNRDYVRRLRTFTPFLTRRDVVMAGMRESWMLPAVVDCRVVGVAHSNPFMPDFEARRLAVARFFDPAVGASERATLIEQFRVTRVLLRRGKATQLEGVTRLPVVFADEVYEIRAIP